MKQGILGTINFYPCVLQSNFQYFYRHLCAQNVYRTADTLFFSTITAKELKSLPGIIVHRVTRSTNF